MFGSEMAVREERRVMGPLNGLTAACLTLGCKVNGYESQAMLEQLQRAGCQIVPENGPADIYLVNTCTVTHIAAHKSRQMLHRMRSRNPKALIVACGCYVDQNQNQPASLEGLADVLVSNREKEHIVQHILSHLPPSISCETEEDAFYITGTGDHTRAFLKVQDGCRQFCSYCIIPYVRGPLTSREITPVVEEVQHLAQAGLKEVVLTGIHLSSYGRDLDSHPSLADLIKAVDGVEGIQRIRLGSLEVGLITDEYIQAVKGLSKLCPHYHLSLQSGAAKTLREMNRRYTPEAFRQAVQRLRDAFPDVAITTDVIVGFPGETDADFQKSYDFINEIGFADIHVFPYSPREGTVAARRTDMVDDAVKRERSERMIELARQSEAQFASRYIGQTVSVLIEQFHEKEQLWEGYTSNYLRVRLPLPDDTYHNRIIPVQIHSLQQSTKGTLLMGVHHARE